jgi:RHS repeat-associated protein
VHVSHYGYDGDDNRVSVGVTTVTVPTYDAQDRLSTYPALNASYAFTANGELVSKTVGSQVTSYTYDVLGNLLHVGLPAALPDGTQTVDYVVDGQNRRVGRKVNGTLVSGWLYQDQLRPVAQLGSDGHTITAMFVYGSKANVPDFMGTFNAGGSLLGTYRILSDHLGSPRLVVDIATGNAIETINFDEFGNETDTLAGTLPTGYVRIPFGFAGGLYDPDTGLVRFGARDYDASVGRFTAKDPTRFSGGMSLYRYVGNDPVNVTDFNGLKPNGFSICDVPIIGLICNFVDAPPFGPVPPTCEGPECMNFSPIPPTPPPLPGGGNICPNNDNGNNDCDEQYEIDGNTCRNLRTKQRRNLCWQSALDRLNACKAGNPLPPLQGWW